MTTETLTFSKARLARLKDCYASAEAEGKEEFEFDGITLLIGYAKYLIEYLDNHFEKAKKTSAVYRTKEWVF